MFENVIDISVCFFFKYWTGREEAGMVQYVPSPVNFLRVWSGIMSVGPKFLSPPALPWEQILTERKSLVSIAADPVTCEGCSRINEFSNGNKRQNFYGKFRTLINALNGIHYYLVHKKEPGSWSKSLISTEHDCL